MEILQRCDDEICHQIFIRVEDALVAANRRSLNLWTRHDKRNHS
jgi:hypothetical protein